MEVPFVYARTVNPTSVEPVGRTNVNPTNAPFFPDEYATPIEGPEAFGRTDTAVEAAPPPAMFMARTWIEYVV